MLKLRPKGSLTSTLPRSNKCLWVRATARTMEEAMMSLRRDVARWKGYIEDLEGMSKPNIAEDIQKWVVEAERLITQWEDME